MELELREWENRIVFRILIATQQKSVSPEDIEAATLKRTPANKLNDYSVMFGEAPSQDNCRRGDQDRDAHVGDLFGPDFISLLQQLKSKNTEAVIAARATPQEAEAKKKKAERREAETHDPVIDGLGGLFNESQDGLLARDLVGEDEGLTSTWST